MENAAVASPALSAEAAERIRHAVERGSEAMRKRDSVGRGTAVTRVRLVDGYTCAVEEGPWKLTVDMAEKAGGNNLGPNPGVLGRSALGSCLAVAYTTWAARRGLPVTALEVEIQADYDARGEYGVDDDISPAYSEVRYVITVTSPAPEEEVEAVLEEAEAHCTYLKIFTEPQRVCRELRTIKPDEA